MTEKTTSQLADEGLEIARDMYSRHQDHASFTNLRWWEEVAQNGNYDGNLSRACSVAEFYKRKELSS